jgi:hypothetical protein
LSEYAIGQYVTYIMYLSRQVVVGDSV